MDKKRSGSYYTPEVIAEFLVEYIAEKISRKHVSILEPSAGDGIFVRSVYAHKELSSKIRRLVAVEKNKTELNKITKKVDQRSFVAVHADFLEFQHENKSRFHIVIGNPPYIRKSLLTKKQLKQCVNIHSEARLSANKTNNIWTAFLARCIKFTDHDGILALVLPSELLQVKFAEELRQLILKSFERIEIFTFNELLFKDCKGQDTVLVVGERKAKKKGVFYTNVEKLDDLKTKKFLLKPNIRIKESKWTHHHLASDEMELLEKLRKNIKSIDHYCVSKAGIVTGANEFFIITDETVKEYGLANYTEPIIQRGAFVNGGVTFTRHDFNKLIRGQKPTNLLAVNDNSRIRSNQRIHDYFAVGVENEIDLGYKSSIRDRWYEVPNVGSPPEAFFFKRCDEYPKLIKNVANVLVTDSAYTVRMRDTFNINSLVFSFYNSLTMAFAELRGRYYGGGVLELTPNEFKAIPLPYLNINSKTFKDFATAFKSKESISDICKRNDARILKSIDKNLDTDQLKQLLAIREKLYTRRIKTN